MALAASQFALDGAEDAALLAGDEDVDAPAQLVKTLAEVEWLLSVAAVGNDRPVSALVQLVAQFSAVVGLVTKHPFRWLHSAQEGKRRPQAMALSS